MNLKFAAIFILLFFFVLIPECNASACFKAVPEKFRLGNEVLLSDKIDILKNSRVALLTNQTGILSDGTHIIDAMVAKGINVVKIFSPEHGIRGDENYSDKDDKTGIPIISLYNGKNKPSASDLADVDIIVYDIQDVGARFYTYTSTLNYVIEAAAENKKKLVVCDRPMIVNSNYVDGFMLDMQYSSFVGSIPTPVCYGLTCGELAAMLSSGTAEVIKMSVYSRSTDYNSLDLKWVKPSPSMYFPSTAVCYGGTCFLEGTNVSEGRGTEKPFEYFGAPWIDAAALAAELNSYNLPGVSFEAITFTPSEKISSYPPKFFGKECNGIYVHVTDKNKFEPVKCGVAILVSMKKLCPEFKLNKDNFIDKLAGTDKLRRQLSSSNSFPDITSSWSNDVDTYKELRSKYLLYK